MQSNLVSRKMQKVKIKKIKIAKEKRRENKTVSNLEGKKKMTDMEGWIRDKCITGWR